MMRKIAGGAAPLYMYRWGSSSSVAIPVIIESVPVARARSCSSPQTPLDLSFSRFGEQVFNQRNNKLRKSGGSTTGDDDYSPSLPA